MDIQELRQEIDRIDKELVDLFCKRMEVSAQVGDYKREHKMPILVPAREEEILQRLSKLSGDEMAPYIRELYAKIFALSRSYQNVQLSDNTEVV